MFVSIAELGINHHGDFEKAKRMLQKALDCGATWVKGQYYNPEKVLGREHPALEYAKQCQFTKEQHEILSKLSNGKYFVSVFNVKDVNWADSFCKVHKIASRMNQNQEFVSKIASTFKPVFMSVQPELTLRRDYRKRFKLMWCVRDYPTAKEVVVQYPYNFIGLSSHCPDWTATLDAVKLGARVIENHLTESRGEEGCDISSSITFEEYAQLLHDVKTLENIRC